jgi:hypothetical protein
MTERYETQVLNYGGGSQTVCMCVLIAEGVLPRPDRIVIANTGREVKSTWDYLSNHVTPYLASHGLSVEIASHELATVDLYSMKENTILLPVFTATGKMSSWCSGEWKTAVVRRHLRSSGVASATQWIGYAYDEKRRWSGKATEDGPWRLRFPLVELRIVQADCAVIIKKAGLPPVRKSRCWMCPNQPNAEWRQLRDESPLEFEEACVMDEQIREDDEEKAFFLHQSRVPLREADLEAADRKVPSRQCTLGTCFV